MEKIDPEYVSSKRPKPITLDKITSRLDELFNDERNLSQVVVVEYFVCASKLYIFCIFKWKLYVRDIEELTKSKLHGYIQLYDKYIRYYPYYKKNRKHTARSNLLFD